MVVLGSMITGTTTAYVMPLLPVTDSVTSAVVVPPAVTVEIPASPPSVVVTMITDCPLVEVTVGSTVCAALSALAIAADGIGSPTASQATSRGVTSKSGLRSSWQFCLTQVTMSARRLPRDISQRPSILVSAAGRVGPELVCLQEMLSSAQLKFRSLIQFCQHWGSSAIT